MLSGSLIRNRVVPSWYRILKTATTVRNKQSRPARVLWSSSFVICDCYELCP